MSLLLVNGARRVKKNIAQGPFKLQKVASSVEAT